MKPRQSLLFLSLLLVGCDSTTSPDALSPLLRADSASQITHYQGDSRARIDITFTNRTADTLSVASCASLWRHVGKWQPVYDSYAPYCASSSVLVAPGANFQRTLWLIYLPGFDPSAPRWEGTDLSGTYRVQLDDVFVHLGAATTPGKLLSEDLRVSPSFELRDNHDPPIAETDCAKHYSYEQVGFWARDSGRYFVTGVLSFWFDTQRVCLSFGVWDNSVVPVLEANLQKYGIPRDAVYIHVDSPAFAL